eukprot:6438542-Amphidinium_carterae.1
MLYRLCGNFNAQWLCPEPQVCAPPGDCWLRQEPCLFPDHSTSNVARQGLEVQIQYMECSAHTFALLLGLSYADLSTTRASFATTLCLTEVQLSSADEADDSAAIIPLAADAAIGSLCSSLPSA